MEYTKGPWVCDVNRFDAHLIAAAPDMYEALKVMLD